MAVAPFASAAASGSIRGRVLGPDGQTMPGVTLQLRNDITGFKADTTSGSDGSYQFFNVPFNPYVLHVDAQSFAPVAAYNWLNFATCAQWSRTWRIFRSPTICTTLFWSWTAT